MQKNSERIGSLISDNPIETVPGEKQNQNCDVMLIEMDGKMSPQIPVVEGLSGRESLRLTTEYKECNVLVVEKYKDGEKIERWAGADYGKE